MCLFVVVSLFPCLPLILSVFSPFRYSGQLSPDASWSSRSERQPYGRQCWRDDSLPVGSQLHHRPHLSRIRLCPLRCHGMACVCISGVCFSIWGSLLIEKSPLRHFILEFSYMLTDGGMLLKDFRRGKGTNESENNYAE